MPPMSEVSGIQRFFAELKRRKVFRIAAVYGAVAFVVLQVADILVPALRLPETFTTGIALLSILGFPIAVVLAWAFESTPEGILKTDAAATGEIEAIVAQPAASRWPSGLLALAGITGAGDRRLDGVVESARHDGRRHQCPVRRISALKQTLTLCIPVAHRLLPFCRSTT